MIRSGVENTSSLSLWHGMQVACHLTGIEARFGVTVIFFDWQHIVGLFVLAIPIACVARTVVFEEVFREPREWCVRNSKTCRTVLARKFFYLFTCEYCFSHWVTIFFMIVTGYKLMFTDFRGYLIGFFSLVFVANFYLNIYSRLRLEIHSEKKEIEAKEKTIEKMEAELRSTSEPAFENGNGRNTPER